MALWSKPNDLKRRAEWLESQTFVVLAIQVAKENEKTAASAEQFFSALHGIYREDPIVQEHVSFEIVAVKDSIIFYVFTPLHLRDFIEGQLYAQYPDLQIHQVTDYTKQVELEGKHVGTTKIELTKEDVYPIKTVTASEGVDPLASITAVMAGLNEGEQVWLQIVVRPVGDEWQNRGVAHVKAIRSGDMGGGGGAAAKVVRFGARILQEMVVPGSGVGDAAGSGPKEPPKLSAPEEAALKGIETKITKLGFESLFRLVVIANEAQTAKSRSQAMLAALKQYNTTNLNGFRGVSTLVDDHASWTKYITRQFEEKGGVLNIEELASLYHFPTKAVETSAISWAGSKKGEAPFNLPFKDEVEPKELTVLGKTDFRNSSREFGIKLDDRKRHIYVIGKSGVGKSTLLENMIIDDVMEGRGVVVVDPHGELADKIIDSVPPHRVKDVVVFDPSDRDFPISFNPLEKVADEYKGMVASGFIGIFKKLYSDSWGPRLEYILRNTVLALLDSDNPTMLGIPRMLTDNAFRESIVAQIKDVVIKDFWSNEWLSMSPQQRAEAPGSILNKVGQFLSTSTMRNIVGQPTSSIDIRQIMDEQKILVVNLSKGKIGEDNMALLGAMMITKVQLAAMSRANVTAAERPDCFLYVDEFQNFATESFATILSEARKYGLGLTIAHQYIAQMSEAVRDAVIGNVGTMVSFRIGAPDADVLVKEFAPVFDANDLVNLQRGHVYVKLLVDGIATPAFSAQTMMPKEIGESNRDLVMQYSRERYARPREEVELVIDETAGYKKKREVEEAKNVAQEILKSGESLAIRTPMSPPVQPVAPAPQPLPVPQPVPVATLAPAPVAVLETPVPLPMVTEPIPAPVVYEQKPNEIIQLEVAEPFVVPMEQEGGGVPKPPRKEKPLKVLDEWVYKEVSQKGGLKWFLGEPEKEVLEKLEQKRLAKELAQKAAAESPDPLALPEQTANEGMSMWGPDPADSREE
ncbi:MAG: type IV secretory system conjugative DNA transfer family protein [bacterium]